MPDTSIVKIDPAGFVDHHKRSIASTIPPGGNAKHLFFCMKAHIQAVPEMWECLQENPDSVYDALHKAAACGLELGTIKKHGDIQIFKKDGKRTAQFFPQYRGYITLLMRAGWESVSAGIVYRSDVENGWFEHDEAQGILRHNTPLGTPERGSDKDIWENCVGAWARLWSKGHTPGPFRVITISDILRAKGSSRTGNIWAKHPGPQILKTAIKRLDAFVSMDTSPEFAHAVMIDDKREAGESMRGVTAPPTAAQVDAEYVPPVPVPMTDAEKRQIEADERAAYAKGER